MLKKVIAFISILYFVITIGNAGNIKELHAQSFSSNGRFVAGWYWLQRGGQFAKWTFVGPGNMKPLIMLCFSTLSTDTLNGGAGYDSKIRVSVNGGPVQYITLKNDCPLIRGRWKGVDNTNTHGVGYSSHGCMRAKIKTPFRSSTITVIAEKPQRGGAAHTAVNKNSLKIIYQERN